VGKVEVSMSNDEKIAAVIGGFLLFGALLFFVFYLLIVGPRVP
jgi:hypothetical protein